MLHNDTHGGKGWSITTDVLKFRKVIEFESSCTVIFFSYIYLIIDGKRSFINEKSRVIPDINHRLKLWARVPAAVSSRPGASHMYR